MKAITEFVRDTIVGGILFLVPLIVLLAILGKAHGISSKIVTPLAERMAVETIAGMNAPRIFAIVLIVLFCFLAGLFAKTSLARRIGDGLEDKILSRVPGYTIMKGMAEGLLGTERALTREAVLVRIEDAWQIGFLVERVEPGHVAVFIPGSPDPMSGTVFVITEDRIKSIGVPLKTAMQCVKDAGKGSAAMLRGKL
jgi:uncharacterized membrane protein